MLTVEVDKRISIEECLQHPWVTQQSVGPNDSTDGLTGAMTQLDFSRRKVERERTLLSSMNDVIINKVIDLHPGKDPVKVFKKNPTKSPMTKSQNGMKVGKTGKGNKEEVPTSQRNPGEFMQMGGRGDQPLFDDEDNGSKYVPDKGFQTKIPK